MKKMVGFRLDDVELREAQACLIFSDMTMQDLCVAAVRLFVSLYKDRPQGRPMTDSLRRYFTQKIREARNE